jgi:tetratricopeptide (TPR) repeat protein
MSNLPAQPGPPSRARRLPARVLVVGAAVVISGVVIWWATHPGRERVEGLRAARDGDFARAEPLLMQALERNPADAEVVESLARGHLAAADPRAAVHLAHWAKLRPDQPEPVRLRMEFCRKHKQREEAFADGKRLLDFEPDNQQLRRTVMNLAFSVGRFEEAEPLCRECIRRQPGDTGLLVMLAEIRRARGDLPGAAAVLDPILKDQPKLASALLLRATIHEEFGEPAKAVPLLREVMASDPRRRATAVYRLSLALERAGRPDEARAALTELRRIQDVDTYAEAIRTQPDNLDLRVRLAESLLAEGDTQDGLNLLSGALALDPRFRPAHRALAAHYEKQGQPDRAAEHRRLAGPDP